MKKYVKISYNGLMKLLSMSNMPVGWLIFRPIVKNMSANAAILFSELLGKYCYYSSKGKLTDDGYFYHKREFIEKSTGFNLTTQWTLSKRLEEKGLIKIKKSNELPAKNLYKIELETLFDLLHNEDIFISE
jgi:hypothetical protein